MNDSGEFQEIESNHSGNFSSVPSQQPVIPSSRSMLSSDKRLPLDTWNTSGPQENVFLVIHALCSIHHRHFIKEFFTLRLQVLQVRFQCRSVQCNLSQEVKNELGARLQCRERWPSTMKILFASGNSSMNYRYRSFSLHKFDIPAFMFGR